MGHIRDRMDADLRLAGRSESTRQKYIGYARLFVKYFNRSPDRLGEQEVREFLLHLRERNLSDGAFSSTSAR
ncbi:MAG: phage integrase N-terminal SAM-like domain-containing protein [Myxococcota bacterium]